jgi:DNA repair exonuclease SbcCD nuclease subunit
MKILATADSHFGYESGRTAQAKKSITQRMFDIFQKVIQDAKAGDYDLVLHGGDMFNRSQPTEMIISEAYDLIENLANDEIPFVGIPGNHDRSQLPESLLNYFNKDIFLLNKFSSVEINNVVILGFPFVGKNPQKILEKTGKIAKNNSQKSFIVLCHQLFDGAMFGPRPHIFRNRSDTLVTNDLPINVKLILSGHIHRSQNLQNRVYYTGSLERTSFMEIVEPKGYLIINVEEDYVEVRFKKIESQPMEVVELDITNENQISRVIDQHFPDTNTRTQLRFIGRNLTEEEIKFLWAYFPAKEFPFLSFSPKHSIYCLKKLYSNSLPSFQFEVS